VRKSRTCNTRLPGDALGTTAMHEMKDTPRALVRISYDGRVHKTFRGHMARERFEQEVRVLKFLEKQNCGFVPRLLESDPEQMKIVTTNCGTRVDQVNAEKQRELFAELETFGVRHEDRELRNITYRASDGRFCIIDFEFATILGDGADAASLKPSAAQ
jgi:tRNA A-37 threonylcarbamoyl transferase component Bud32